MEWDNEKCVRLIDLYKLKPEIWQTTHKFYRSKIKKQNAWNEIAKNMETTTDMIKLKVNSLLSSFRRERAKEENSAGTVKGRNDVYRSKWFGYEAFQFLMDKNQRRKTSSIAQKIKNFHEEIAEIDDTEEIADEHSEQQITIQGEAFEDTEVDISLGNMQYFSHETTTNSDLQRTSTQQRNFLTPKAKKNKIEFQSDPRIDKVFDLLQTCAKRDASEVYGEHIAMKLRSYSRRTQSVVQHLFSKILFNADMGQYDVNMNASHTNVSSNNNWSTSRTSTSCTQPPSPYSSDIFSPQSAYSNNSNQNTNVFIAPDGSSTKSASVPSLDATPIAVTLNTKVASLT